MSKGLLAGFRASALSVTKLASWLVN